MDTSFQTRRRPRPLRALGALAVAGLVLSCIDWNPLEPRSRTVQLRIEPQLARSAAGGPTPLLAKAVGWLVRAGTTDSLRAEAPFEGDSAILVFELEIEGSSESYELSFQALDDDNLVLFEKKKVPIEVVAGDNPPPAPFRADYVGPDAALAALFITPEELVLERGTGFQLQAAGFDDDGTPISRTLLGWTARDPGVVTVNESGVVTAGTLDGSTWVIGTTFTGISDSTLVHVHSTVHSVEVDPAAREFVILNDTGRFNARALDAQGRPLLKAQFLWMSTDEAVATVDQNGLVRAVGAGMAKVIASAGSNVRDSATVLVEPRTGSCAETNGGTLHDAGTISASETWTRTGSPHRLAGDITVSGAVLSIEPGAFVCLPHRGFLLFKDGGRLSAVGTAELPITFAPQVPDQRWNALVLSHTVETPSVATHVRLLGAVGGLGTEDRHTIVIDGLHGRRIGGIYLGSPGSRIARSVIDSSAVGTVLGADSTTIDQLLVRHSMFGIGLRGKSALRVRGVRLEGSQFEGILAEGGASFVESQPVRITGSARNVLNVPVEVFAALYPTRQSQDSLLGNPGDSVIIRGGRATVGSLVLRSDIPWFVEASVVFDGTTLNVEPGARLVASPGAELEFVGGGRLMARGTNAAPIRMQARIPDQPWGGVILRGAPFGQSELRNVRIERAGFGVVRTAVLAVDAHRVTLDSVRVFQSAGRAVHLGSDGSQLNRSIVDGTLDATRAAVYLGTGSSVEGTTVRGANGVGVLIDGANVTLRSSAVRESGGHGVLLQSLGVNVVVTENNFEANAGNGVHNLTELSVDAIENWWGSTGGPLGTGGDGVSANVNFTPFRTTPVIVPSSAP